MSSLIDANGTECSRCGGALHGRLHMRPADWRNLLNECQARGSMSDDEWRTVRDGGCWAEVLRDDYEFFLAHHDRRTPQAPDDYHRFPPHLVPLIAKIDRNVGHKAEAKESPIAEARARVAAVGLLCSQTSGRLRELLCGYHVLELEALVAVLECAA